MTLWIIIRKWIKKYVFLYLFSGTLPYRGEMRLCVIYPIPLSMFSCHAPNLRRGFSEFYMMSLQNKMVKPFGAQMCYKTFWAPRQ